MSTSKNRLYTVELRGTMRIEAESEEKACEYAAQRPSHKWDWDSPTAEAEDDE